MTTYTGPTPYDTAIARLASLRSQGPADDDVNRQYWALIDSAGGYRWAKAEDAPLLEAAEAALLWMDVNLIASDISGLEDRKRLRAAIAQARKE